MSHSPKRDARLVAAGLCRICGEPNNGSQLCAEHRRIDTIRNRNRRRVKAQAFADGRLCGLCRGHGHRYDTCPANPEVIR